MPVLDLTDREAFLLTDVLSFYLSELRMEIADTERKELREEMKERKELIIRILQEISCPGLQTAPDAPEWRPEL